MSIRSVRENDRDIREACTEIAEAGGFLVVAFGSFGGTLEERRRIAHRRAAVLAIVREARCETRALALATDGTPRHPARLAGDRGAALGTGGLAVTKKLEIADAERLARRLDSQAVVAFP